MQLWQEKSGNMSDNPKISVIVLVYNVEDYIEKCTESLFSQTFDSIEYIFVNDCSTDESIKRLNSVIRRYPERKESITILDNEQNLGQAISRIRGIEAASGEYIIACDSDDYLPLDAYEKLYDHIVTTESDIVACDFYRGSEDKYSIEAANCIDTPLEWIRNLLLSKKMGALWCHLIKRSLLKNLIKPEGNIMEDVVILVQSLLKSNKVSTLHQPLYYYIQHSNSITNNPEKINSQIDEMNSNLNILRIIISSTHISLSQELDCKRFFVKKWTLPLVNTPRMCGYWIGIQPEINKRLFFNPFISLRDKLISGLIYLRLYPLLKKIM